MFFFTRCAGCARVSNIASATAITERRLLWGPFSVKPWQRLHPMGAALLGLLHLSWVNVLFEATFSWEMLKMTEQMETPTIFKFGRQSTFFFLQKLGSIPLVERTFGKRISRVRSLNCQPVLFCLAYPVFFSAFQLLVFVSFCWFPLGKSWEQLGSLLATMTFLCKTSHIDHGFGGVAAMNVRKLVWCLYNGPCWTTGLHGFQLFVVNVVFNCWAPLQASTDLKGVPIEAGCVVTQWINKCTAFRSTTGAGWPTAWTAETTGKNVFRNGIPGRRAFRSHHQPLQHQKRGHLGQNQQLDCSLQFWARLAAYCRSFPLALCIVEWWSCFLILISYMIYDIIISMFFFTRCAGCARVSNIASATATTERRLCLWGRHCRTTFWNQQAVAGWPRAVTWVLESGLGRFVSLDPPPKKKRPHKTPNLTEQP